MSQTLKARLQADLTTAMKARDTLTAGTLRMALTSITNAEVAGKSAKELSDAEVEAVLTKEVKKRMEAADVYRGAGRADTAEQEEAEAEVLQAYLPEQLATEEVQRLIDSAVADAQAKGLAGGRAMGAVMGALKPSVGSRFDGAELARMVKQSLGLG